MHPAVSADWKFCLKSECRASGYPAAGAGVFWLREWLARYRTDALKMGAMRQLAARDVQCGSGWGLPDQNVIERVAGLIAGGAIHVHVTVSHARDGSTAGPEDEAPAASPCPAPFPLSLRRKPLREKPAFARAEDPDTFPDDNALNAQAAALAAASARGQAFCPE